ncbi:hypothetical protein HY839_03700 [Candidatus Azambacteria bacterium]|nr:hypothetical protein [Candidatus Azambacteria bacterium]
MKGSSEQSGYSGEKASEGAAEEKEFDITPAGTADEKKDEKEWDISVAEETESPEESASEGAAQEEDPLSVQPEWYDNVRRGLPSTPTPEAENEPEPQGELERGETENKNEGAGYMRIPENYLKSEYDAPEQVREEAENAVAEMPEKDRESIIRGFLGLGYDVQKFKGKTLSKVFTGVAEKIGERKAEGKLEKKPFVKRLFEAYGKNYSDLAERAQNDREKFNKEGGAKGITKSAISATGTLLTWGRAIGGFGTPLGTFAAAAIAFGKGGEMVKEAHLRSEDVIEEGRVHDIDAAEDEARKLYAEAKEKSEDGAVTKEQLMQTYKERLPQDLIDRLARDAGTEGFIAKCAQMIVRKDIELSAKRIQGKLSEIEKDSALSKEQKEKRVAGTIKKYERFLKDMDRIVGNGGAVDAIAYGSRLVEKGGKAAATLVALETLGELAWRGTAALEALTEQNSEEMSIPETAPSIESAHTQPPAGEILLGEEAETMLRESKERLIDFALKEKLGAFDLTMDDLAESELDTVELELLVNGVEAGGFGGNTRDIIMFLAHTPEAAEKLDDDAVRSLLSNETMSAERVEEILGADKTAVIGKGESISEVLGASMPPDAKVTVVNPDGTELEDFDANLVHEGDTVAQNADGTITVFKTSDSAVNPEHSLQGVYDSIKQGLDEKGVPSEFQNALNKGEGHWEGQVSRAEASEIEETWNSLKADFDALDEEGKKMFLGKLSKGMTGEEISAVLREQLGSEQELATEEVPQDIREQFVSAEGRKAAAEALEKAYAPEEIERAKIPGETDWPPIDGKTPEERIAPDAWSEDIRKGERFTIHDDALDDVDAREQVKAPAHEISPPERLPEVAAHAESDVPEIVLKTGENEYIYNGPAGDFKGKFSYNENNEITGFRHEGGTKLGGADELRNSVLKEGWREKILGRKGGSYLIEQKIKMTADDLGIRQRILTAMERAGDKDTKEYQFLKKTIATRIGLLEKTYGDIFK